MGTAGDAEKHFESEFDRLTWLIASLKALAEDANPSRIDETTIEAFVVCSAWVRQALSYGEAIEALGRSDLSEAVGPILRALYETWAELVYFLRHGDRQHNAHRVTIASILELQSWLEKSGRVLTDNTREGIQRQLDVARHDYPDVLAEVVRDRNKRRFHWSGLSRTELMRRAFDDDAPKVYAALSWEVHGVMSAIRDYRVDRNAGKILFSHYLKPDTSREQAAFHAGGMLFFAWNEYAREFGLPIVTVPTAEG